MSVIQYIDEALDFNPSNLKFHVTYTDPLSADHGSKQSLGHNDELKTDSPFLLITVTYIIILIEPTSAPGNGINIVRLHTGRCWSPNS